MELRNALNEGLLPPDYYALAEQTAGGTIPDVLTLQAVEFNGQSAPPPRGTTEVAVLPPRVRFTAAAEAEAYLRKQRTLVIRHSSGDRVVALVEIISPGNKHSQQAFDELLSKVFSALAQGYHMLLIDLQPPSPRDPHGLHDAVWNRLRGESCSPPPDKLLTLMAYAAGSRTTTYVEPVAVGDRLADMPLFLAAEHYINVPLEATYQAAYRGVPQRWRQVLET